MVIDYKELKEIILNSWTNSINVHIISTLNPSENCDWCLTKNLKARDQEWVPQTLD